VNFDICLQGKLKKIQEKYGDQDEEERELRLRLLAVIDVYQSVEEFFWAGFHNIFLQPLDLSHSSERTLETDHEMQLRTPLPFTD